MQVDRLRLLGGFGSNKVMQGEVSRLVQRALGPERSRALREQPPKKCGPGAIFYPFAADLAALILCYHRTSARVLWDLFDLDVTRLEPLYDRLTALVAEDSRGWLDGIERISVLAFGTGPVAAGERQIVGTVKNALLDGARATGRVLSVDSEDPQLTLHVRPFQIEGLPERLALSIDLAGRPMHQRGYRLAHGIAPLREDLAAQLVFLSRFDARREVMIDPLAGAGTILFEATLLARAEPLRRDDPPLRSVPVCLRGEVERWGAALFPETPCVAVGAEHDPETCEAFLRNASLAGVRQDVRLFEGDFMDPAFPGGLPPDAAQLVLCNPPYGARLSASEAELSGLYQDLGRFCRRLNVDRAAFLVGEPNSSEMPRESSVALFLRSFGGKPRIRKPISNGPLRAQFLMYD